ncbi:MAG: helix-turn-helix domain-containing protein [Candidatus Falkowbacteria bacterium]
MENAGKIFRIEREKLRLSVEDVSKDIKIRPHIISDIEAGEFDKLPGVYMKAFVRDYAKFLKLNIDVDELINSIAPKDNLQILAEESGKKTDEKQSQPKRYEDIFSEKKIKKNFFNRTTIATYLIYSALVLILISILYFAFFNTNSKTDATNHSADSSLPSTEVLADESLANTQSGLVADSMRLTIMAKDTVWLRLANDGISSKQIVLYPGNDLEMRAWEYFTLTCDKASAIEVRRDGELLPLLSNRGSIIRNVKITRNDIINPTSVFSDSTAKRRQAIKNAQEEKPKQTPYKLQPARTNFKKQPTNN